LLFSFKGSIGRYQFFIGSLIAVIISMTVFVAGPFFAPSILPSTLTPNVIFVAIAYVLAFLFSVFTSLVLSMKRLRNIGNPVWFSMFAVVPAVNFFLGMYLLFTPGKSTQIIQNEVLS
jgi:uncharacterized membrane protein YhaH (DUF805 family)